LQESTLFNRTIHENIALAAPGTARTHVIEVARLAGADDFITRLPLDMIRKSRSAAQTSREGSASASLLRERWQHNRAS